MSRTKSRTEGVSGAVCDVFRRNQGARFIVSSEIEPIFSCRQI